MMNSFQLSAPLLKSGRGTGRAENHCRIKQKASCEHRTVPVIHEEIA